jgi:23S rRNA (uracil1939-C5)-methyltransferase
MPGARRSGSAGGAHGRSGRGHGAARGRGPVRGPSAGTPPVPGAPFTVNSRIPLAITGLSSAGEGIGRFADFTVFVPHTAPEDEVEVRIVEVKSNYARAEVVTVKTASRDRVEARCGLFYACGGCDLQHIAYRRQLALKTQVVRDAVERIAKLESAVVLDLIGAPTPWHYRNKVQVPVGRRAGEIVIGCYTKSSHSIVDTDNCLIQHPTNNRIIQELRKLIVRYNLEPYDERVGQGFLRHILARVSHRTGQAMVVLVTNGLDFPEGARVAQELMGRVPQVAGIIQNVNIQRTNVILGQATRVLAGSETLDDAISIGPGYEPLRFKLSAKSFYQTNPEQTEALYQQVLKYADLSGQETVVDVYSGVGTITLFLAQKARKAYGIETVGDAVNDARFNARLNRIDNTEFLSGEAEEILPQLSAAGVKPDVIVVDPPRKGCDGKVLDTIAKMDPSRLIYVSCNPATMARDLGVLAAKGFGEVEIQPVDMFPQTAHVECVARLRR